MNNQPIVNKKMVKTMKALRKNQAEYKRAHGKGKRTIVKNYIGFNSKKISHVYER